MHVALTYTAQGCYLWAEWSDGGLRWSGRVRVVGGLERRCVAEMSGRPMVQRRFVYSQEVQTWGKRYVVRVLVDGIVS